MIAIKVDKQICYIFYYWVANNCLFKRDKNAAKTVLLDKYLLTLYAEVRPQSDGDRERAYKLEVL